jgi:hypothetical protein
MIFCEHEWEHMEEVFDQTINGQPNSKVALSEEHRAWGIHASARKVNTSNAYAFGDIEEPLDGFLIEEDNRQGDKSIWIDSYS